MVGGLTEDVGDVLTWLRFHETLGRPRRWSIMRSGGDGWVRGGWVRARCCEPAHVILVVGRHFPNRVQTQTAPIDAR